MACIGGRRTETAVRFFLPIRAPARCPDATNLKWPVRLAVCFAVLAIRCHTLEYVVPRGECWNPVPLSRPRSSTLHHAGLRPAAGRTVRRSLLQPEERPAPRD